MRRWMTSNYGLNRGDAESAEKNHSLQSRDADENRIDVKGMNVHHSRYLGVLEATQDPNLHFSAFCASPRQIGLVQPRRRQTPFEV